MKWSGTVALAIATAAPAQDASVDELKRLKEQAELQSAISKAQQERAEADLAATKARYGFLPSSGADGKVTLGDKAGGIEAAMLSARAIRKAAEQIVTQAKPVEGTVLLAGSEAYSVDALVNYQVEAGGLERAFGDAGVADDGSCAPKSGAGELAAVFPAAAIGTLISGAAGMLRTDTEIKGVEVALAEQFLARAVEEAAKDIHFVRPNEISLPKIETSNPVYLQQCRLRRANQIAKTRSAGLTAKSQAKEKEKLDALSARYQAFTDALEKADANGLTRLGTIYRQSLYPRDARILRVFADVVGGTIITRRNLWTALGFPAVGVTGAVIASYSLIDPGTGKPARSGILLCGTALQGLRDIQHLDTAGENCWEEKTRPGF